MENLPLIFKRYTSENGGKELLGAVELRLELPGEIFFLTYVVMLYVATRKPVYFFGGLG